MCDINKVFKIVSDKECNCETAGKDIIMFLAVSQNGKSTTINIFRGAKYELTEDEPPKLTLTNNISDYAAIGDGTGRSCTVIPGLYKSSDGSSYYFDIQGFGNTDKFKQFEGIQLNDQEIEVISSILTEIAMKKAKSVKIVLVVKYDNIKDGIKDMQETCDMIVRHIKPTSDFPLFILINRFNSTNQKTLLKFAKLTGPEKTNFIYQLIKEKVNSIDKNSGNQKNMECWGVIKSNFDERNVGYIDVEDSTSIENIKRQVNNLKSCSTNSIIFNNTSKARSDFNKLLEDKLKKLLADLQNHYKRLIFPQSFFDSLISSLESSIANLRQNANTEYSNGDLDDIKSEIKKYKAKIEDFENKDKKFLLYEVHFTDADFTTNQIREVTYNGPYDDFDDNFGSDTYREIIENEPYNNHFYAKYAAKCHLVNWGPTMNVNVKIFGYKQHRYPDDYNKAKLELKTLENKKLNIDKALKNDTQSIMTLLEEQNHMLTDLKTKNAIIKGYPTENPLINSQESKSVLSISKKLEINTDIINEIEKIKNKIENSHEIFTFNYKPVIKEGLTKDYIFTNNNGKEGNYEFFKTEYAKNQF